VNRRDDISRLAIFRVGAIQQNQPDGFGRPVAFAMSVTRIHPLSLEAAPPKVQETYKAIEAKLGVVPNMMKTMANSPAVLDGYLAFSGALAKGTLPARLREQIAIAVAQANQCEYCLSAHTFLGAKAGLTPEGARASREAIDADSKTAAALVFARQVTVQRGEVSAAQFDSVREAGWSDAAITEIIANVALNVFTNYINVGIGTEIDFPRVPLTLAA
jgi:uncharacterized peroxidase-related enzyme